MPIDIPITERQSRLGRIGLTPGSVSKIDRRKGDIGSVEKVTETIQGLKARGFADPVKLATNSPSILGLTLEKIDAKVAWLASRGFADPVKLVSNHPRILSYRIESMDAKFEGLKDRGFSSPVKLVVMVPSVLGMSFANIDAKIGGLKARGFADPVKLIASYPSILSLSLKNIDAKIAYLGRIRRIVGTTPQKAIEKRFVVIGMGMTRLSLAARVAYEKGMPFLSAMRSLKPKNLASSDNPKIARLARRLSARRISA